jgi:hypothetical protein
MALAVHGSQSCRSHLGAASEAGGAEREAATVRGTRAEDEEHGSAFPYVVVLHPSRSIALGSRVKSPLMRVLL